MLNFSSEKKESDTDEQFIYKTRKKGFGKFKSKFWDISNEIKVEIGKQLEKKVAYLFTQLKVENTLDIAVKNTRTKKIFPSLAKEIIAA